MKTVHLIGNVAFEIIPEYALPVEKWYGVEFASQCVEAPDDVKQGMVYDPDAKTFSMQSTEPTLADVQAAKLEEINAACDAAITSGCDVTLSDGTAGHISLTAEDQINLTTAQTAVTGGTEGYPYHLDGQLCKIYPAADILTMAKAATAHILYHATYCNHLHVWVSRCAAVSDVEGIAYGCDLPADLAANMEAILATMGDGNA